jgi:hypothetical protein
MARPILHQGTQLDSRWVTRNRRKPWKPCFSIPSSSRIGYIKLRRKFD